MCPNVKIKNILRKSLRNEISCVYLCQQTNNNTMNKETYTTIEEITENASPNQDVQFSIERVGLNKIQILCGVNPDMGEQFDFAELEFNAFMERLSLGFSLKPQGFGWNDDYSLVATLIG